MSIKVLHTSDWHLGRALYGRSRMDEFERFLSWLLQTLDERRIDFLLVSGDIFDTGTPGAKVQRLYYRFLLQASEICSRIVLTAGNHDSPAFLNAPQELLGAFRVSVVGQADLAKEFLVLKDKAGAPALLAGAVPFLRDRDLRRLQFGASSEELQLAWTQAFLAHYQQLAAQAAAWQQKNGPLPFIAMGHFFASGGRTADDGSLSAGLLEAVDIGSFPNEIDYLALGHLHLAQNVAGKPHWRYCGAPLPMGFNEAGQTKQLSLVEFDGKQPRVTPIAVPVFQPLERLKGDEAALAAELAALKAADSTAWLELEYTGDWEPARFRAFLDQAVAESRLEILRIKNRRVAEAVMRQTGGLESLEKITPQAVFDRLLQSRPEDERGGPAEDAALKTAFDEALQAVLQEESAREDT